VNVRPPAGEDIEDATRETPVVRASDLLPPEDSEAPKPGFLARFGQSGLDLRNTWQIVAGAVLLPLGVAVILLGWAGAAHGRVDQQQIPYIISGGVLGLAIVIVGCFFFWAHWMYRIYDQADLHHQAAMREQSELIRALMEAVRPDQAPPAAHAGNGNGRTRRPNGARSAYVATPTGTNFHTLGCPIVANRLDSVRGVTAKEAVDMKPCRICDPLGGP
jgi:hypothetical protein